jgi:hypothetical protein
MAVDAGAQRIYELLNQDTPFLRTELAKVVKAAQGATDNPYGVMAQSGIEALAAVRQFYRTLRAEIAGTETADTASKAGALKSLDALDAALDSYEASLELGISRPAAPKAQKAEKRARKANEQMKTTLARLR